MHSTEKQRKTLRSVMTSVTAAPKSILWGYELRYGPSGVHRLCLGCFESDSKKNFFDP